MIEYTITYSGTVPQEAATAAEACALAEARLKALPSREAVIDALESGMEQDEIWASGAAPYQEEA